MNHPYAAPDATTEPRDEGFRIHDDEEQETTQTRRVRKRRRVSEALAPMHDPRAVAIADFVKGQFERRPYVTLGVALAIGFLVGGGLSTRIGRMALAGVARAGLKEVLRAAG